MNADSWVQLGLLVVALVSALAVVAQLRPRARMKARIEHLKLALEALEFSQHGDTSVEADEVRADLVREGRRLAAALRPRTSKWVKPWILLPTAMGTIIAGVTFVQPGGDVVGEARVTLLVLSGLLLTPWVGAALHDLFIRRRVVGAS